jgi:hypothetical protein
MIKSQKYLRFARKCFARAQSSVSDENRTFWSRQGELWLKLFETETSLESVRGERVA